MSESDQENHSESGYFSPEATSYQMPYDPYDARLLQFTALQSLGYPVEVRSVPFGGVGGGQPLSPLSFFRRGRELSSEPVWVRPAVTDPAFARFIEYPDSPGEVFNATNDELDPRLSQADEARIRTHGILLNAYIDVADVNSLAAYVPDPRGGEPIRTATWSNELLANLGRLTEADIAIRAFATGMRRHRTLLASRYPFRSSLEPDERARLLNERVERDRVPPLDIEAQIGLSADYYRLIESMWPLHQFRLEP